MSINQETTLEETCLRPATDTRGPGVLTVTLSSARGVSADETFEDVRFDEPHVRKRQVIYAILEYGSAQAYSEAVSCWRRKGQNLVLWFGRFGGRCPPPWTKRRSSFQFDVSSASSELTVSLFGRKLEAPTGKQEVTSLGWFKLRPLLEPWVPGEQWVDVEDGTGQLKLEVSFLEKDVPPLGDSSVWSGVWSVRREVRLGDLVRVEKCDTNRTFAMRTIRAPDTVPCPETVCRIEHPFVAPLEFALESPKGLSLLSPVASGGYLFSYLQRERRFGLDKAKMYTAELTCALESLHSRLKQPVHPKPENIALDAFGHVSKAVDWWSLGILLYEMLTGLPPFYNADIQEQRNQIINQVLHLPEGLPTAAGDFLMKLLDKDPVTRLGANGASEVKAHTFFDGVDWPALMQPRREVLFDPSEDETVFRLEPDELRDSRLFHETGVQRVSEEGVLEKQILWTPVFRIEFWYPVNDKDEEEDALEKASSGLEDDEWELEWDPETQVFRFDNRVTGEKRPVQSDRQPTSTSPPDCDPAAKSPHPSQSQKKDALKAALEARYSNRTVSQILGYDVDLDDAILPRAIRAYGPFVPGLHDNSDDGWRTPLEWATDTGNAALVQLLLENGADANFCTYPRQGPALVKAVKKGNQKLVDILLPKSNRITSTRALCHAVERQDVAIVTALLANGVLPDFQESDRPQPVIIPAWDDPNDCTGCVDLPLNRGPPLAAQDFTPPLVRAARLGNAPLVRLLLAHGADVNAAYHVLDLHDRRKPWEESPPPVHFSCGRAAQVAEELGHSEVVQFLLDGGADVGLPPPHWPVPGHTCPLVPRSVYLRVTAGLEALAAARRMEGGEEMDGRGGVRE